MKPPVISLCLVLLILGGSCQYKTSQKETTDKIHTTQSSSLSYPISLQTQLDSINRNLHILSTYTEGDYPEEFDAASVASATADDIVSAINNHPIHIDSDIPNLNKTADFNGMVTIYNIRAYIDGTKQYEDHPILVWHANGTNQAVRFPMMTNIHTISELNEEKGLYLLLGSERLSGWCTLQTAYVVQIKDGELNLHYPAFAESPQLSLCSCSFPFSYDAKKKTLNYKTDIHNNLMEELMGYNDSLTAQAIYPWIIDSYMKDFSFSLKFDGNRFKPEN